MPLQPVTRRSVPDEVFDQVLAEVVDGGIEAGEALPSERRLAEVLGVSRPGGARGPAADDPDPAGRRPPGRRDHGARLPEDGGLDLLPRLLVRGGEIDLAVARSILEARLVVGPGRRRTGRRARRPGLAAMLADTVDALAATDDASSGSSTPWRSGTTWSTPPTRWPSG